MSFKAWGGLISSDIIPHKGTRFYCPLRSHGQIRLSRFGFLTTIKLMANWFSCSCNRWKCLMLFFPPNETLQAPRRVLKLARISVDLMWYLSKGNRGSTVVKVLCYKSEGRWFDPSWWQWIFRWHKKSFRSHYDPGVDSDSNRNE